jgi:hypothetical protein
MPRVPAPRQIITKEKTEALIEPGSTCLLIKRAGDPAALRNFYIGDDGGSLPFISVPASVLIYKDELRNLVLTFGRSGALSPALGLNLSP